MEKINSIGYVNEHQIEEKIPYFGKARLYTIPVDSQKDVHFEIPREIFHFVTAIYILNPKRLCDITLKINSYEKIIKESMYSEISNEVNLRHNLIQDPIFLGNHIHISLQLKANSIQGSSTTSSINDLIIVNVLIEYAKILPQLFLELHTNNVVLSSKQDNQEILIYRGNAP